MPQTAIPTFSEDDDLRDLRGPYVQTVFKQTLKLSPVSGVDWANFLDSLRAITPLDYPLVNIHRTSKNDRKSPCLSCLMGKSTINGHFQYVCLPEGILNKVSTLKLPSESIESGPNGDLRTRKLRQSAGNTWLTQRPVPLGRT